MGKNSKIQFCDHTWNPWQGCHRVSAGCANCYMYREKNRYGQDPSVVVRSKNRTFNRPLHWKEPAIVFTCSWSDFFIEEADEWRDDAWQIIRDTPHLTYLVLTKRIENVPSRLPEDWLLTNVWLGVTAENQETADERIPLLLETPAMKRWVSVEPMLGKINIARHLISCETCGNRGSTGYITRCEDQLCGICDKQEPGPVIDWLVCGCESGPKRRQTDLEWVRDLRDQCIEARTTLFIKQLEIDGELVHMPELDGVVWDQIPERK